ncbi:hypothetical protein Tco_0204225 [Tanacetum coccineum]
MVWSGYAVLMYGKTDSIKLNNIPGCLPGSTFVYSEVFKLDFSSASHSVRVTIRPSSIIQKISWTEEKVDSSKALDASLVIIESNGIESQEQDTSSRSGNDAHVDDADIRPIDNEEPGCCTSLLMIARILKTVCLRWVPTGKTFASSTTKVESEPPNGSNEDIPNQCQSEQALKVSACTLLSTGLVLHQMMSDHNSSDLAPQRQEMSVENVSSGLVPQGQKASDYET